MSLVVFIQQLLNGLSLGSLYALIAIGYTMVYGILQLINFAHGDIFMIGAYIAFFTVVMFKIPWVLAAILTIILTAGVGMIVERIAYRPQRSK